MILPAEIQVEILRLHFAEHLPLRAISRQLGVDRKSVRKVVERRAVALAPRAPQPRPSLLDPHRELIRRLLEEAPERSAINVLHRLRGTGYQGGISILRDHLRQIRPREPQEAFNHLDFAPGEAAQVDWGDFGDVFDLGCKVYAFVMVLCFSRMLYLEFTLRQTLPTFLRCFERALAFFGARCRDVWLDNMPTAVAERRGRLIRCTPGFLAYCGFHGLRPVLCGIGKGNEKGRVENGVKYVRSSFWPGRTFGDLDDLNGQALVWRDETSNRREHGATRKIPELLFEHERQSLLPLREEPYDGTDDVVATTVSPFFRVRFDRNDYSVPWTLAGASVVVRGDDRDVRIFYGLKPVAHHPRCFRQGQDLSNPLHEKGLRERKTGASRSWDVETVQSYGPHCSRYLQLIQAGTRSLRHELKELLVLATVYGAEALEQAVARLLAEGAVGSHHLERLLRLAHETPKAPPPLQITDQRLGFVPPAPDLRDYDRLLLEKHQAPASAQADNDPEENDPCPSPPPSSPSAPS